MISVNLHLIIEHLLKTLYLLPVRHWCWKEILPSQTAALLEGKSLIFNNNLFHFGWIFHPICFFNENIGMFYLPCYSVVLDGNLFQNSLIIVNFASGRLSDRCVISMFLLYNQAGKPFFCSINNIGNIRHSQLIYFFNHFQSLVFKVFCQDSLGYLSRLCRTCYLCM